MATNLVDWKSDVWAKCLCPEPALIEAVRSALIDFCEMTYLWSEYLAAITVVADTQSYTLTSPYPTYAEIVAVDDRPKYKQDGEDDDQYKFLDPVSELQLDRHGSGSWKYQEADTPNEFWADITDKKIHLKPIPTAGSTSGLLVKCILRPTKDATQTSDFLYNDYRNAIRNGALFYLFSSREMTYYDAKQAAAYITLFNRDVNPEKWKRITGAANVPTRVRFRPGEFA